MAGEQEIKVGSYQNLAFDGAWKSRSRAIWGIAFLGLITGAVFGLLAPFFPVLVQEVLFADALTRVLPTMAIFSATGMAAGFAIGGLTGASAGASASVAKELEIRNLQREKEVEKSIGIPFPEHIPEKPKEDNTRYFNPKISAVFATFGAIVGKVMAAAFFATHVGGAVVTTTTAGNAAIPALSVILGSAVSSPLAVTACFVGVMACFGAIFGVNFPKIGGYLQDLAGKLLSGEALGTNWKKENNRAPNIVVKRSAVIPLEFDNQHSNHAEKFKNRWQVISYRELVTQPNSNARLEI